jgi:hypothetical protein
MILISWFHDVRKFSSHSNGKKLVMVYWACCPSYGLRWK